MKIKFTDRKTKETGYIKYFDKRTKKLDETTDISEACEFDTKYTASTIGLLRKNFPDKKFSVID